MQAYDVAEFVPLLRKRTLFFLSCLGTGFWKSRISEFCFGFRHWVPKRAHVLLNTELTHLAQFRMGPLSDRMNNEHLAWSRHFAAVVSSPSYSSSSPGIVALNAILLLPFDVAFFLIAGCLDPSKCHDFGLGVAAWLGKLHSNRTKPKLPSVLAHVANLQFLPTSPLPNATRILHAATIQNRSKQKTVEQQKRNQRFNIEAFRFLCANKAKSILSLQNVATRVALRACLPYRNSAVSTSAEHGRVGLRLAGADGNKVRSVPAGWIRSAQRF